MKAASSLETSWRSTGFEKRIPVPGGRRANSGDVSRVADRAGADAAGAVSDGQQQEAFMTGDFVQAQQDAAFAGTPEPQGATRGRFSAPSPKSNVKTTILFTMSS